MGIIWTIKEHHYPQKWNSAYIIASAVNTICTLEDKKKCSLHLFLLDQRGFADKNNILEHTQEESSYEQ